MVSEWDINETLDGLTLDGTQTDGTHVQISSLGIAQKQLDML